MLSFELNEPERAILQFIDLSGSLVKILLDEEEV